MLFWQVGGSAAPSAAPTDMRNQIQPIEMVTTPHSSPLAMTALPDQRPFLSAARTFSPLAGQSTPDKGAPRGAVMVQAFPRRGKVSPQATDEGGNGAGLRWLQQMLRILHLIRHGKAVTASPQGEALGGVAVTARIIFSADSGTGGRENRQNYCKYSVRVLY